MKMIIEKMNTSAAMGNKHNSIMVRNTVFHKIRGALGTKFQINKSLVKASSGITQDPTVKARFFLAVVSICGLAGFWKVPSSMSISCLVSCFDFPSLRGTTRLDVIGTAFEALTAHASAPFENTRGYDTRYPRATPSLSSFFCRLCC